MATAWYYASHGEQKGPVTTEVLMALVASGQLSVNDLIWKKGLAEWVKVGNVSEFAALTQAKAQSPTAPKAVQPKPQPHTPTETHPSEDYLRLAPDPDEIAKKQKPVQEIVSQVVRSQAANPQADSASKKQTGNASKPQAAQWYYTQNGQQQGPVTAQTIKEKAQSGELLPTDRLWKDGLKDWVAADSLPGLKFSASNTVTAAPIEVVESVVTPSENAIFDIMNDPSFASAPAANEKPNVGLATMPASKKKKKKARSSSEDDDGLSESFIEGVFVLLGLALTVVLVLIGLWRYSYMNQLLIDGVAVEGTVVDVRKSYGSSRIGRRVRYDPHYTYQPTVRFTTEDGQNFTFQPEYSRTEYSIGDIVEVIYMPQNPKRSAISGSHSFSMMNLWMCFALVIFAMTAWAGFKWFTKRQNAGTWW